MKKAMMLFAALTLCAASAQNNPGGRSTGTASTNLIFNTTVLPGCAVNLDSSYTSQEGATYNGTDVNPEKLEITVAGRGGNTMLRCQTGTGVNFRVSGGESLDSIKGFDAGVMDYEIDNGGIGSVSFSGDMSLHRVLNGTSFDDNKRLDGKYSVKIKKFNIAGGNGDTYGMTATFTPKAGEFEPMVGEYTGTLVLNVDY